MPSALESNGEAAILGFSRVRDPLDRALPSSPTANTPSLFLSLVALRMHVGVVVYSACCVDTDL